MFLYQQHLFYYLLAYQQAMKHPKKFTLSKIMTIFLKWWESTIFRFSQFVLNIFSKNLYYPKALRKCYDIINIPKFYFGKKFNPPIFANSMKIEYASKSDS
jgi:DNA gyrase/topoisomerase IV subunit A